MEKVINIEKISLAVMTGTPEEVIGLCGFIHIESCFDYVCDPPADFLEQCKKYRSGRGDYSAHYIREDVLLELVPERIQAVNEYIREDQKRVEQARKHLANLDMVMSRLYEDYALVKSAKRGIRK